MTTIEASCQMGKIKFSIMVFFTVLSSSCPQSPPVVQEHFKLSGLALVTLNVSWEVRKGLVEIYALVLFRQCATSILDSVRKRGPHRRQWN